MAFLMVKQHLKTTSNDFTLKAIPKNKQQQLILVTLATNAIATAAAKSCKFFIFMQQTA